MGFADKITKEDEFDRRFRFRKGREKRFLEIQARRKKMDTEKLEQKRLEREKKGRRELKASISENVKEQEKKKKKITKRQKSDSDKILEAKARKQRKGLREAGEGLKRAHSIEKDTFFNKLKQTSIKGIIHTTDKGKRKILQSVLRNQSLEGFKLCPKISNGRLAVSESGRLNSISRIQGKRVVGILTYIKIGSSIKISLLCSNTKGTGTKLVKELEKRFSGTSLKADSVDTAIGFYKKLGFTQTGSRSNQLTPMLKQFLPDIKIRENEKKTELI